MAFFSQSKRTPEPPAPDGTLLHIPLRSFSSTALGAPVAVSYFAPTGDTQAHDFETAVRAALRAIEERFSGSEPGSLLSQINASAGRTAVPLDPDAERIFDLCDALVFMTQGRVDPTVLPLLQLWRQEGGLPAAEEVADAKALVGWGHLQRKPGQVFLPKVGMGLDFSSFLQGMAAETIGLLAREKQIPSALARVGNVYRSLGSEPGRSGWRVAIPPPVEGGTPVSVILVNASLALVGGGDGLRVEGRRSHSIIDLKSGWPVPPQTLQAAVVGLSAIKTPVVAIAAFIQGPPVGIDFIQSLPGFEGRIETSSSRGETRDWRHVVAKA